MAKDEYQIVEDRNGKWVRQGWHGPKLTQVEVVWRLNKQLAEIKRLQAELAEATNCPDCNGRGKRWYSLYGEATCERCKGSGDR